MINMTVGELLHQIKKPTANPGGGAVVIFVANMAINLIRMMDKKIDSLNVSYETLDKISEKLNLLADEDIKRANELISEFKKKRIVDRGFFIRAADPQIEMVKLSLIALKNFSPILQYGRKETLSDGVIANNMLKDAIINALPTIKINLSAIDEFYDYEATVSECMSIYNSNIEIIERRK